MDSNYSNLILEYYLEVQNYEEQIIKKMHVFASKCKELEELTNRYQIQKTLEDNKTFFQGYICDSDLCIYLNKNSDNNFSITEVKDMFKQFQNNSSEDLSSYHLALELYEKADEIEELIDNKIEYEMKKIYSLSNLIGDIEKIPSNEYEGLYYKVKEDITDKYLNNNLMDDKATDICFQMINHIFNYFIYGYIEVPEEYLQNNL